MPHAISPPVGLTSVKQLPGRFVRITSSRALGLWHDNGVRLNREWQAQSDLKRERDEKFFTGAAAHNRWPALGQFTCRAIVGGRRCSRITIIETGHQRCLKHAGPTAALQACAYRENCRKLFESGRLQGSEIVQGRRAPDADPDTRSPAAQAQRLATPWSDLALPVRDRGAVPGRRGARAGGPVLGPGAGLSSRPAALGVAQVCAGSPEAHGMGRQEQGDRARPRLARSG